MSYNYVVTAQKPTAVAHCLTANFTSAADLNLIVSKVLRIEVHTVTPEGLQPVVDVPLYGRVILMRAYRAQGRDKDYLFLAFERYSFCVLEYAEDSGTLLTVANGELVDRIGRKVEFGQIGIVDSSSSLFTFHLYEGLIKILPISNSKSGCTMKDPFNLRVEELRLIDMCYVKLASGGYAYTPSGASSTSAFEAPGAPSSSSSSSSSGASSGPHIIAVLFEDSKRNRHLKTYIVAVEEKDLLDGPFSQSNVESTANMLLPVTLPCGGLLIVGEELVTYHSGSSTRSTRWRTRSGADTSAQIRASCAVDSHRFLLGDELGRLFLLTLELVDASVSLQTTTIAETVIPSCLCYLGSGLLFVGGCFTDSQLLRLTHPDTGGPPTVEPVDSFTNLGPIVDFVVVDLDRQGQGQIVTCSGASKDGSIRIVRNGIGINELASMELTGVKGMWSLMEGCSTAGDAMTEDAPQWQWNTRFLVISFIGETKLLSMQDEETIEEAELPGLAMDEPTLLCPNV
eukprot:RCo052151